MRLSISLLLALPTLVLGLSRTSPPSGAKVVRKSPGSGEYGTVSAAVAALTGTATATIFIYPGTYTEQVVVLRKNVTIYGYTTEYADTDFYPKDAIHPRS